MSFENWETALIFMASLAFASSVEVLKRYFNAKIDRLEKDADKEDEEED